MEYVLISSVFYIELYPNIRYIPIIGIKPENAASSETIFQHQKFNLLGNELKDFRK